MHRLGFVLVVASGSYAFAQSYSISTVAGGTAPLTPAVASSVSVAQPQRVIADAAGNLYFSGANSIFKMDGKETLTLVAGNGRAGFAGDGGPAAGAQFDGPTGLARDAAGALYVADTGNNRVRKISPDGTIATIAGSGRAGFDGDGGPAIGAQIHLPSGVAIDASGNLYIADTANQSIRKVTTDGNIATIAGNGFAGFSGDAGAATSALLTSPKDVAIDSAGNLYIADTGNGRVRKITTDGVINTLAGGGTAPGDGGQATGASLEMPFAVALDSSANLYVVEYGSHRIRKVSTTGVITTVAGSGTEGFAGDGGTAASAQFDGPTRCGFGRLRQLVRRGFAKQPHPGDLDIRQRFYGRGKRPVELFRRRRRGG
jgi:sugar lactone lactonase YvrE